MFLYLTGPVFVLKVPMLYRDASSNTADNPIFPF